MIWVFKSRSNNISQVLILKKDLHLDSPMNEVCLAIKLRKLGLNHTNPISHCKFSMLIEQFWYQVLKLFKFSPKKDKQHAREEKGKRNIDEKYKRYSLYCSIECRALKLKPFIGILYNQTRNGRITNDFL